MRVETNVLALYHETNAGHATMFWHCDSDNETKCCSFSDLKKNVKPLLSKRSCLNVKAKINIILAPTNSVKMTRQLLRVPSSDIQYSIQTRIIKTHFLTGLKEK